MLTWHPAWPRKPGEKLEPELWEETQKWDGGVILWIVSPDKKLREPIPYYDREQRRVLSAKDLEKRIRAIFAKHKLRFTEPPPPPEDAEPPVSDDDEAEGDGAEDDGQ